jgi:AraC-like DNA-binding protein
MGAKIPLHKRHRALSRLPAKGTLIIGPTSALPTVLRSLSADPEKVLAEAGFSVKLFDKPENRISYAARGRLLAHCVATTNCQHLGLLVGQQSGLLSLGLVGLLVKYSRDVGTALRSLVRYFHVQFRGAVLTLIVEGGIAMLCYDVYEPRVQANDQVGDGAVAIMFNMMRELCGPDWKPAEAWFAHRKPEDIKPFRKFFRAPLRFDAEHNALLFSASWLTRPLSIADQDLRILLQKQIEQLDLRNGEDFLSQVRSVLRQTLSTGQATVEWIASLFNIHSRTLNRHLNAHGTGFQQLLDECRFETARKLLEESVMGIADIAATLDYTDARSFIRAFRRWSGTTPARWRARQINAGRNRRASKGRPRTLKPR